MSDIHALSGAYAMDALDDLERAQFKRHLAQCPECAAEVESLQEATAMLAETTAVAPPPELRARLLAEIKTVRPLPPLSAGQPAADATRAPDQQSAPESDQQADLTPTSHRTGRPWLRGLVAAAAVVALLGAGGAVWQPWNNDSTSQNQISAADRVLAAPDATTHTRRIAGGGEVTLVASKSLNKFVVTTKDLPALTDDQVYEMWLQDAERGMVPAGLMSASDATVVLDGNVANAVGAGITVEPAGGSSVPTSDPVVLFDFENA